MAEEAEKQCLLQLSLIRLLLSTRPFFRNNYLKGSSSRFILIYLIIKLFPIYTIMHSSTKLLVKLYLLWGQLVNSKFKATKLFDSNTADTDSPLCISACTSLALPHKTAFCIRRYWKRGWGLSYEYHHQLISFLSAHVRTFYCWQIL